MTLLDLNADEVEQVLRLAQTYKPRFSAVAEQVFETAKMHGMTERIARAAIVGECLLLAAFINRSDERDFVLTAAWAFQSAEASKASRQ